MAELEKHQCCRGGSGCPTEAAELGPGLASSPSAAEHIPQLCFREPVGMGVEGKCWSSCILETVRTVQKVLKGFSVSCSTLYTPATLVLGLGEKTCELLPLLMVTSCLFSAAKSHSCKCLANSLGMFWIPDP